MRLQKMMMVVVLGSCSMMAKAQMAMDMPAAKPVVGSMMAPSKALDDMLSLFEGETMGVVKAMPAEKYDFAPSSAIFVPGQLAKFDTVRTFAQQVTHVAGAGVCQVGDSGKRELEFRLVARDGRRFHARLIARRAVMSHRQPFSVRRVKRHHLIGLSALRNLFQRRPIRDQANRVGQRFAL